MSKRVHPLLGLIASACVTLGLSACGGDSDSTTSSSNPPASTGSVSVQVTDASTGSALSGATVTAGGATATTDANGQATLSNVSTGDRVVIRAAAGAHDDGLETVAVVSGSTATLSIQVQPIGASGTVPANAGGTITVPNSPASVQLPADGFVKADGSAYTGTVTVALTPIDPATNVNVMPGDYLTSTTGGTATIESFGALSVKLTGSAGEALNLGTGKTAIIRIPVATRSAIKPSTIPLFYFNESTGLWVQEGTAALDAGSTYYEGSVSHFTVWNADQVAQTIQYTGCVQDAAGAAASGVRVTSEGIDYSGASSAVSNANGQFTLPIKLSSLATLIGQSGAKLTNTVSAGPYSADTTNTSCLVLSSASAAISIKLSWGAAPSDVDSHLYLPDGSHVYFGSQGSLTAAPFANLDVDDTTSFGPEVVTVTRLMVGTYAYWVDNYSESHAPGLTGSPVRVEATINGVTTTYTPPAGETNSTNGWSVFALDVDAQCRITTRRIDTWSTVVPSNGQASTPTYCTP